MLINLPASKAARRVACPGSRALEQQYPDREDSPYSKEGKAAHWAANTILKVGIDNFKAKIAPNGESITNEMIEGAKLYYNSVKAHYDKALEQQYLLPTSSETFSKVSDIHIEEILHISSIHPRCFGTPDCWFIQNNTLFLFDYKFGHGQVEVYENWQLLEYAAGILQNNPVEHVIFFIVQPRSFHREGQVRQWAVSQQKLNYYFETLKIAENNAAQVLAPCFVSSECKRCTARHVCPTLQINALDSVDISLHNTPNDLDEGNLGKELAVLKHAAMILDARITGLEEQAKFMITKGKRVPGFKLDSVSNREVWTKSVDEIIVLGKLLGINLTKDPTIVTPAQARKLGVEDYILNGYISRQKGALKLIEEDITDASKIFGENK
jgi:hypothetical protein